MPVQRISVGSQGADLRFEFVAPLSQSATAFHECFRVAVGGGFDLLCGRRFKLVRKEGIPVPLLLVPLRGDPRGPVVFNVKKFFHQLRLPELGENLGKILAMRTICSYNVSMGMKRTKTNKNKYLQRYCNVTPM